MSHPQRTERRAQRKEDGEDDAEEDEPVEIQLSDVTMHPKGTPAPASSVKAQVFEERVDLSNDMTWRQMIAVGVRRVVLARTPDVCVLYAVASLSNMPGYPNSVATSRKLRLGWAIASTTLLACEQSP